MPRLLAYADIYIYIYIVGRVVRKEKKYFMSQTKGRLLEPCLELFRSSGVGIFVHLPVAENIAG